MAQLSKIANTFALFVFTIGASINTFAQEKTVEAVVDSNATDSGLVKGSPVLWLLFVVVCIVVIVVLSRGRRNT